MSAIPMIDEWAGDKFGFYVDRHWDEKNRKWLMEPGPIKLADYHARILRHCFTIGTNGRMPYDQVAICEPAKSGKSAIAGLVHQYFALHIEPGSEQYCISNKKDQAASKMYKSLTESIGLNPFLPNVDPTRYSVTFRSGTMVQAIPSNARTEAGARFTLATFDEPWAIMYEDGERLVSEFKTDPTRNVSVKLFVGYAGYLESKLWFDLLKLGLDGEPVGELMDITNGGEPSCWRNGRTFVFWSQECRQPWQTEEWIDSQNKSLRSSEFARMIRCEFVEGIGNFCDPDDWYALIDPDHKRLEPGSAQPVYVGLDAALSPGGDDCALVGVYREDNKAKIAFHRVWKGRSRKQQLKLGQTVLPFLKMAKDRYRIHGIYFDPWQAQHLSDELRSMGLRCYEVTQTQSSRGPKDTALWEAVMSQRLVLYDHPDLRNAAAGANAQELGNGMIFLKKAGRHQKIDLLVALSNCADIALKKSLGWSRGMMR